VQEEIHNFAAWIPGLTADYNRLGYWRWVRWPEYFQVPRYFFFAESGVFWIDTNIRQETDDAKKSGRTMPPVSKVYDRWKDKE